jgi:small subunit ribosomal protein S3
MGQKVNPHGLRVGVIKDWDSKWYAEADFADLLVEDYNIRTYLKKKLYAAGVSKIEIERASDRVKVIIYTAKPGVVIGKGGAEIEKITAEYDRARRFSYKWTSCAVNRNNHIITSDFKCHNHKL